MELILQVDERRIGAGCELDVAKDSAGKKRSDFRRLAK